MIWDGWFHKTRREELEIKLEEEHFNGIEFDKTEAADRCELECDDTDSNSFIEHKYECQDRYSN